VFELLWVIIGELFVGVVYNPPKPSYDLESFLGYLEATVDEISCKFLTSEIAMVGDFNQLLDTDLTQRRLQVSRKLLTNLPAGPTYWIGF